jgi:hypothetical protein
MTFRSKCEHCGEFGKHVCSNPEYPAIPAAKKFRAIPRADLTPEQSIAYSDALTSTVRRLQDAWWRSERAVVPPNCVSGTWHNNADGSVGEAIAAKQRTALMRPQFLLGTERGGVVINRERTDEELRMAYAAAMQEKRRAAVKAVAA